MSNPVFYYPILWSEKVFKKPVFGCHECGQCILSYTVLTCPKQLRNGPCGGTRPGGKCEVFPERACVRNKIYNRAKKVNRLYLMEEVQPCVDSKLEGTSAWVNVFQGKIRPPRWR